jgi:hypothetical protein
VTDDECIHGVNRAWCGICRKAEGSTPNRTGEYGFHGGRTKQDLLNQICDLVGLPRAAVGRGSSLPSHVFNAVARRVGVGLGSMPEIGERVAHKAGMAWGPECDSRGSVSGGGSTVTADGLEILIRALNKLL